MILYFRNALISLIKKYSGFFIPYAIFLVSAGFFLLSYNRIESHIVINQLVSEPFNLFFTYVTHIGGGMIIPLIVVSMVLISYRHLIYMALATGITGITTGLLKNFAFDDVNRPFYMYKYFHPEMNLKLVLPPEEMNIHHSFPSGHTSGAFALFVGLMLLSKRPKLAIVFFLAAFLTGYSRVYLSQHFVIDIYFGSLLGTLIPMLIWLLMERYEKQNRFPWWHNSLFGKAK